MTKKEILDLIIETKENKIEEISLANFHEEIPCEIFGFDWLKRLHLYECPKLDISSCFKLANLTSLGLRNCGIHSFVGCEVLTKLEELNLEGNNLIEIPNNLPQSIANLDISGNQLCSIDNVTLLPNLLELYLIDNQIHELPSFANNAALELLEIGNNKLSKFPTLFVDNNYVRLKENQLDVHIYGNPFIKNLNLNANEYVLRAEWGYLKRQSNSECLVRDRESFK